MIVKRKDRRQDARRAKEGDRRGGIWSLIVEPYLQIRLSVMVLILNVIFGFAISAIVYYYVVDIHNAVSVYFDFNAQESLENWEKFFWPFFACVVLVVIFFVLTFFIIVRYTHKIYGPLVSIHYHLDALLEGKEVGTLSVRSSDQLVSLAEKLNELTQRLTVDTEAVQKVGRPEEQDQSSASSKK